jgi:hypothetical protein
VEQSEDPTRAREFDSALGMRPAGEDVYYAVHRRGERSPEYRERRVLDSAAYMRRLRLECAESGAVVEELTEAEYRERSSSARRYREALRVVSKLDDEIAAACDRNPSTATMTIYISEYHALRAWVKG